MPIFLLFLISRLWTAFWTYRGHALRPFLQPVEGGWEGVSHWLLNPWTTYDSQWYLEIAKNSYQSGLFGFFPIYPLLLRAAGPSEISMAFWGVLISNLAFLAALFILNSYVSKYHGKENARVCVFLLCFFPTASFFMAVYTESLFLLAFVACYALSKSRHWVLAGLLGATAGLTRNIGFLISLTLWADFFLDKNSKDKKAVRFLSASMPFLAFCGFQIYVMIQQSHFSPQNLGLDHAALGHRHFQFFLVPVFQDFAFLLGWKDAAAGNLNAYFELITNLGGTLLAFALLFYARQKALLPYAAYLAGLLIVALSFPTSFYPHTTAMLRYLSTAFPFFIFLSEWLRKRQSTAFTVLLLIVYLFINARYSFLFGLKSFL